MGLASVAQFYREAADRAANVPDGRASSVDHESITELFNDHIDAFGTWGDRGWFFGSPRLNDRHPSYEWFLNQLKAAAKAAGTPQYTPKSFRHFFVSEAIHAAIPLFEIAAWVGHRSTRTTELVYGHLVRRAMERGARTMQNRLGLKLAPFTGLIVPGADFGTGRLQPQAWPASLDVFRMFTFRNSADGHP